MTTPNNPVAGLAEKLLPCPFCGSGQDNATEHPFPVSDTMGGHYWIARCGSPGCAAQMDSDTEAGVIAAWNRRALPAPSAGVGWPMTDAEVRQWIDACNHAPARQVLRDYLQLRALQHPAAPSAPPSVAGDAGELPELPRPDQEVEFVDEASGRPYVEHYYTADQMRAYGEQCRRLATAEQPDLRDSLRQIVGLTEKMDPASCEDCYSAACIANGALARAATPMDKVPGCGDCAHNGRYLCDTHGEQPGSDQMIVDRVDYVLLLAERDQLRDRLRNCEAALEDRDARILATSDQPGSAVQGDADELLRELGLDASRFRSEGGFLNAGKVRAALLHPADYSGLYLPREHAFVHSAKLGGDICTNCGAMKGTHRASEACSTPPAPAAEQGIKRPSEEWYRRKIMEGSDNDPPYAGIAIADVLFKCSNPDCQAVHATDPRGPCPKCIKHGRGWSCYRFSHTVAQGVRCVDDMNDAVLQGIESGELDVSDQFAQPEARGVEGMVEQKDCPKCTQAAYQRDGVYRECLCGKYAATGGYSAAAPSGVRVDDAMVERLGQRAYEVHCETPIREFPNNTHAPKWQAVVRMVIEEVAAISANEVSRG